LKKKSQLFVQRKSC